MPSPGKIARNRVGAVLLRLSALLTPILVIAIAVIVAGCGSDDSSSDSATKTSSTTTSAEETNAVAAGLVGEWSTENVCEHQARALQKAGLDELVSESVGGAEYPGRVPRRSDPCRGAKPMRHSHSFGEDGSFASYDQNGQQVDDGSYTKVDSRTFTLGDPPVTVHYRIQGRKSTFDVVIPDCKTKQCRESAAYVVSVFFPRVYKRAD